ncbi:cytochrome P450 [Favolaschia claudopus]|uniref:Cytochrome P450 n=1 Tax=Favolaschia claudopus TaxID=2862362 RepID=A0AAW0BRB6_9AGAR
MSYIALLALLLVVGAGLSFVRRGPNICRYIPGPSSSSWVFGIPFIFVIQPFLMLVVRSGHLLQLRLPLQIGDHEFTWLKKFGPVYRIKGSFGEDRLMVADPAALQHILNSGAFGELGPALDAAAYAFFGKNSVMVQTGHEHSRLRAGLNPGFTAAAISEKLDLSGESLQNVSSLFSIAAFDAISEAVLGCPKESLAPKFVEVNLKVMNAAATQSPRQILLEAFLKFLPKWIRRQAVKIPTQSSRLLRTQTRLATEEGCRVAREKLQAVKEGLELNPENSKEGLSFEDIVGQTSIIMIAGGETTANSLAFGFCELAKNIDFQNSLRAEIHAALSADASDVAYDSMPLLNAFIKAKMYPAVPFPERLATEDTIIPLSDPIVLRTGEQLTQIPVQKGQVVMVAIASHHRVPLLWAMTLTYSDRRGGSMDLFIIVRLLDRMRACKIQFTSLTFMGGGRTCLGTLSDRDRIMEMQIIICELLGKFSFSLPANHFLRVRYTETLQPADAEGKKSLRLDVKRLL